MKKEYFKKFSELGLLEGLDDNKKELIANRMGETVEFCFSIEKSIRYSEEETNFLGTVLFPIVRLMIDKFNYIEPIDFEKLSSITLEKKTQIEKQYKEGIDVQAEVIPLAIYEYIGKHNNRPSLGGKPKNR